MFLLQELIALLALDSGNTFARVTFTIFFGYKACNILKLGRVRMKDHLFSIHVVRTSDFEPGKVETSTPPVFSRRQ